MHLGTAIPRRGPLAGLVGIRRQSPHEAFLFTVMYNQKQPRSAFCTPRLFWWSIAGSRLERTRMENSGCPLFCRRSKPPTIASCACSPPLEPAICLQKTRSRGKEFASAAGWWSGSNLKRILRPYSLSLSIIPN